MSIIVGKIENKFWRNGSYKQPNNFPVYSKQREFKDRRPSMTSFIGGNIYLEGGDWNHCIYEGAYYAMYILKIIDKEKDLYHYRLERELWFDVLASNAQVIGDLSTSNNDELLEKHLNRTFGVLDNPSKLVLINFDEKVKKLDWNKFDFKESTNPIEERLVSKKSLHLFQSRAMNWSTDEWKKKIEKYYSKHRNPAVFIFSYLYASTTTNGWKNKLRNKINEFCKDVLENKDKYRVSRINDLPSSKLQGKFVITWKQDGIGTKEEKLSVKSVDLSGLTDIIPIDNLKLVEMTPITPLTLDNLDSGGVFDFQDFHDDREDFFVGKITKKAYLPTKSQLPNIDGTYGFRREKFNWSNVQEPQKITYFVNDVKRDAFLFYLDNLNFTLGFTDDFNNSFWDIKTQYAPFLNYWGAVKYGRVTWAGKFPIPWIQNEELREGFFPQQIYPADPFRDLGNDILIRFGFLIYQIYRKQTHWRLFEYRNEASTQFIKYISGIKRNFLNRYSGSNEWWSDLSIPIQPSGCSHFCKFYLDNYLFSWLSFFPNDGVYDYAYDNNDPYKIKQYLGGKHWIYEQIRSDVNKGKWFIRNPYNQKRIIHFIREKEDILEGLLLFENLKTEKQIDKGDYFFSDQEYSIEFSQNRTFLLNEEVDLHSDIYDSLIKSTVKIEDFTKEKTSHFLDNLDKFVVLCSTLDGNFEIRTVEKYRVPQFLSTSQEQIIDSVDGAKNKNSYFYHLKPTFKFTETTKLVKQSGIPAKVQLAAVASLYKLYGHKVESDNKNVWLWNYFSDNDLKDSNQQHWFKLVGTSWYCMLHKGRVHLVSEDSSCFETIESDANSLCYPKKKDPNDPKKELDELEEFKLIEKVNQKVRLQFYGVPFFLNWKTTFTPEDQLNLIYKESAANDLVSEFNHYFVYLDTPFDQILWEEVPVPKVAVKAESLADDMNRESLHFSLLQNKFGYSINQERYQLAEKRYQENITRAQNRLNIQKLTAIGDAIRRPIELGLGAHLFGGKGINIPVPWPIIEKGKEMASFEAPIPTNAVRALVPMKYTGPDLPKMISHHVTMDTRKLGITTKDLHIKAGLTALGGAAMSGAVDLAFKFSLQYPEQQRMIDMDRQLGAEELAIQSLVMDTSHMERQIQTQMALNNLSNRYSTPMITQANLLEEYRSKFGTKKGKVKIKKPKQNNPNEFDIVEEERDIPVLNPVHLAVFIPTLKQRDYLDEYKEEFGIMCDIPNISTDFYPGMKADVIRYSRISDEGIFNIPNPTVRGYLHNRMIVGTKIVPIKSAPLQEETRQELKSLLETRESEKVELNKEVTRLENELANKTTQHDEKAIQIDELNKQLEKLNKDLENCKRDYEEQKQKAKDCEDVGAEQLKEIEKLEEEIKQCKINLTNIQQAKETCDRINAAEQKKLKAEIGTIKQQLAERTQEKENLNNLKQDLERQLAECLAKPKATPEELQAVKDQLEAEKRKSDDCRNQITNLTNRLNAKQQELDELTIPNACEIMHQMIRPVYEVNIQTTSEGSKAEELMEYLAHQMNEIDNNEVARHVAKYPLVNKIAELIEELDNVKGIYILRDAMMMPGWSKYKTWKKTGKGADSEVDEVIELINEVKDNLSSVHMHGLKALLDEIAFRMYKAKQTHSIKNKKDPDNPNKDVSDIDLDEDLQFLFGSFMDGWTPLYKQLFGEDIDWAIKRRLFHESQCVAQGGVPIMKFIGNINTSTHYVTTGIPQWQAPPEAHFIMDAWNKNKVEIGNCQKASFESFTEEQKKVDTYSSVYFSSEDPSTNISNFDKISYIAEFSEIASNYPRYWSKKSGSASKYFSWMKMRYGQIRYLTNHNPENFYLGMYIKSSDWRYGGYIDEGIYLHWAGQLTPEEFFKKRIDNWKKMIQAFHNAISHEDLRDQIKREKRLNIVFRMFQFGISARPYVQGEKRKVKLKILKNNKSFDIVKNFGVKDAYKAFWIITVLSENGLYMNKVWQGNDGWKYRIQPISHPFHEWNQQEIIDKMTAIASGRKKAELFIDFGHYKNLVLIVSCLVRGDYSVLDMPKTLEFLKKLNNVGYYKWSVSEDADPNDWDFD